MENFYISPNYICELENYLSDEHSKGIQNFDTNSRYTAYITKLISIILTIALSIFTLPALASTKNIDSSEFEKYGINIFISEIPIKGSLDKDYIGFKISITNNSSSSCEIKVSSRSKDLIINKLDTERNYFSEGITYIILSPIALVSTPIVIGILKDSFFEVKPIDYITQPLGISALMLSQGIYYTVLSPFSYTSNKFKKYKTELELRKFTNNSAFFISAGEHLNFNILASKKDYEIVKIRNIKTLEELRINLTDTGKLVSN